MSIAGSKYTYQNDIRVLKNVLTLSEVLKIKEWIDIQTALEVAAYKDQKLALDKINNK